LSLKNLQHKFIYTFNYDRHYIELCKMESRQLFGEEEKDKLLFSNLKFNPAISPFLKNRLDIILSSHEYSDLLKKIKQKNIHAEGFKVEYLILEGDTLGYTDRLDKLRDVGYRIEGEPEYYKPIVTYSIGKYMGIWYFGILNKKNVDWDKHKKKPFSFSNSLEINISKTLVCVASKGDTKIKLLDACCGVGTVLLEACYSGFDIEGCDINWKAVKHTRQNLAHYNYTSKVYRSDIKDLDQKYDAIIVDLPYNLLSYSDDLIVSNIIESSAALTTRMVIVSISDISKLINKTGFDITDSCTVGKSGKGNFSRKIWLCEKGNK